ncbi:MAG TPA: hypothetical protein VHM72_11705, partial [Solirubrobacteraceae bacterium]|nr:hypothetical protein [Solirubrobacteraceae bacterium]
EAVGSFESRVIPQLRRIEEAGAASEREVALAAVEEAPRALSAALDPSDEDEPPLTEERPATVAPIRAQSELHAPSDAARKHAVLGEAGGVERPRRRAG